MADSRSPIPPSYTEATAPLAHSAPPSNTARPAQPQVHNERGNGERVYFAQVQYTNYTEPQPSPADAHHRAARAPNNAREVPRPAKPSESAPIHISLAALCLIVLVAAYLSAFIPLIYVQSHYTDVSTKLDHERTVRESERQQWQHKLEDHNKDEERWQSEVLEHQRLRREWEIEKEAHRPYFEEPVLKDVYCRAYNTREYKARLWNVRLPADNWLEACMSTEVQIHGRTIRQPNRCADEGWGVIMAYWTVDFDEVECKTVWGRTWDKGCVRPGIHGYEAPLWGQKPNDDRYEMCQTTPGNLPGLPGDLGRPIRCERRGRNGGDMIGVWEVPDSRCRSLNAESID